MTINANDLINQVEEEQRSLYEMIREAADYLHDNEGKMMERNEAVQNLSDELNVSLETSRRLIRELISDQVDPVEQILSNGEKYVGVIDYGVDEDRGFYYYVAYDDVVGRKNRLVCAQCVKESNYDDNVTTITSGNGQFSDNQDASVDEMAPVMAKHYEREHSVKPESVETGAILKGGTTIAGAKSWHAGNDGPDTGLHADLIDGMHWSDIQDTLVDVTGDTMTGSLNIIDSRPISLSNSSDNNNTMIHDWSNDGTNYLISPHNNNGYIGSPVLYDYDEDYWNFRTELYVNNSLVLREADEGHNNGINADQVDDYHGDELGAIEEDESLAGIWDFTNRVKSQGSWVLTEADEDTLNVDKVDDHDWSDMVDRFVDEAGDTMTGNLDMQENVVIVGDYHIDGNEGSVSFSYQPN